MFRTCSVLRKTTVVNIEPTDHLAYVENLQCVNIELTDHLVYVENMQLLILN